jgi:Uma2 family endonuclease
MTAHPFLIVDKATFYRFVASAPEGHRYEFVNGRILHTMTGGTHGHNQIALRAAFAMSRQLASTDWAISVADRGVETARTVRYPDVVVEMQGADTKSLATSEPVVVVEVLSEGSSERDLETKPLEYLALPSLQAYIVASQDEPVCQIWLRGADGSFPAQPDTIDGRDQVIHIPALSIAIPLAEVYRGIGS